MIQTGRLLLRPQRRDDLQHLDYALRPEFYRYLPIVEQTMETIAAYLEQRLREAESPERQSWVFAIEPLEVGHLVGNIRISITSTVHRTADMGYGLNSVYQHRGYATEAARAILEFGFHDLGMHRICATADVENVASWRVLERVGMQREGLMHQDKLVRGKWRDSYLYAILQDEHKRQTPPVHWRKT